MVVFYEKYRKFTLDTTQDYNIRFKFLFSSDRKDEKRQGVLSLPVQTGDPPDQSTVLAAGTRAGGVYRPATEPLTPEPVQNDVFFSPNYAPSVPYLTALRYALNLQEGEVSDTHVKIYDQMLRRGQLPLRNRAVSGLEDQVVIDGLPLATRELAVIPWAFNTVEPFGDTGLPPGTDILHLK